MANTTHDTVKETFKVTGESLVDTVKNLLHEGNIRRITIKDEKGKVLVEFPITFGIIGALISPVLTVIATFVVLFKEYTITVEKIREPKKKLA